MRKYLVTAQWDEEAGVWVATSDDIPGLVSEAKTIDDLVKRVVAVAPELLEDNAHLLNKKDEMSDLLEVCVQSTFSMHAVAAH
ncbi:DUF1902 domain-containing protein [Brucella pseudintermedia]|uniref:DUF1902 domain-containing protein n=1 Tax=Brucella pseudintermedia TaxID=370111 RepID=UPI0013C47A0C